MSDASTVLGIRVEKADGTAAYEYLALPHQRAYHESNYPNVILGGAIDPEVDTEFRRRFASQPQDWEMEREGSLTEMTQEVCMWLGRDTRQARSRTDGPRSSKPGSQVRALVHAVRFLRKITQSLFA